jgi:hypothetical protein
MVPLSKLRATCAGLIAGALGCSPALALVSLNEGTDHIYVTGSASMAYDSNIFAHAGSDGDYIYSAGLLFEYVRRAGWIGVNGSLALNASRFGSNTTENFNNPRFGLEFVKTGGRTTGALAFAAIRESEADAVINQRVQSWNYNAAVNFKYPVIERYSFAGSFSFADRIYDDPVGLTDLLTYTAGTDLFYQLSTERDFVAGYQFRRSETSSKSTFNDHSFTFGLTGRILPKLSGSLRAGYQVRTPVGTTTDGGFKGLTANGAVTWTMTKKLGLTGHLARDVSVTSTNESVDTTAAGLEANYTMNGQVALSANVGTGANRFLSVPGAGRRDVYFEGGGGVSYKMKEHLKAALSYAFLQNWSTFSYSDFTRHTVTFTLSSRW